jgi:hypothetical protein
MTASFPDKKVVAELTAKMLLLEGNVIEGQRMLLSCRMLKGFGSLQKLYMRAPLPSLRCRGDGVRGRKWRRRKPM